MGFLDHKDKVIKLLDADGNGVRVLVGLETGQPELMDSSVIIKKYRVKGREAGAIGVLGPTRMDYARLIAGVNYLSGAVGDLLEQLGY